MGRILSSGSKIIDFEQIFREPLNFLKGAIKNKVVVYVLEIHEIRTTPVNECMQEFCTFHLCNLYL